MACLGSATSTRVEPPSGSPNSVEKSFHCTGSVSWNSSMRAMRNRRRSAELGQQIVEGECAGNAVPALDLVDGVVDETATSPGRRGGLGVIGTRDDAEARVAEHLGYEAP